MLFGIRLLLAGLVPTVASGLCLKQQRATTSVQYEPAKTNGCPVIKVTLAAGKVAKLFLDTGASHACLTKRFAATLMLDQKPAIQSNGLPIRSNGRPVDMVTVPVVAVGSLQFADVPFMLIDDDPFRQLAGDEVDGAIGANFLDDIAFRLQPQSRTVTFWYPGNLDSSTIDSLGFQRTSAIPLSRQPKQLLVYVDVKLGGAVSERLIIDTGAAWTIISRGGAKRLYSGNTPGSKTYPTFHGTTQAVVLPATSIDVGNCTLGSLEVGYLKSEIADFGPRIAWDFFSQFDSLIDLTSNKLYLRQQILPKKE